MNKDKVDVVIRRAREEDMARIQEIYSIARNTMKKSGNPTQWGENYPTQDILKEHMLKKQLYVNVVDQRVQGVFALVAGADKTYEYIEDGQWLNEENYVTMHLVASSGEIKGVFEQFCNYAKEQCSHVRIDTHMDNKIMQHCIEKQGFVHCGRIYVRDHSPRLAYQWSEFKEELKC